MHQKQILQYSERESFKSTAKSADLLIVFLFWLKIAGIYDFNNPKTENKKYHRILFIIPAIFNVLFYISIATFCLFILFIFPLKKEGETLSIITLAVCLVSALGHVIMYVGIKNYLPELSERLLRSQSEQARPGDQSKALSFWWTVLILAFPITTILTLFVTGIVIQALSNWESGSFIVLKLCLHSLIVQAILHQAATLFLLIGTCFHSWNMLRKICRSIKDLSGMDVERLGPSIRSLCNEYSDFFVLMDKLSNNVILIIVVLILTLGECVFVDIKDFRNFIDVFELYEVAILFTLSISAKLTILITIHELFEKVSKYLFIFAQFGIKSALII